MKHTTVQIDRPDPFKRDPETLDEYNAKLEPILAAIRTGPYTGFSRSDPLTDIQQAANYDGFWLTRCVKCGEPYFHDGPTPCPRC